MCRCNLHCQGVQQDELSKEPKQFVTSLTAHTAMQSGAVRFSTIARPLPDEQLGNAGK